MEGEEENLGPEPCTGLYSGVLLSIIDTHFNPLEKLALDWPKQHMVESQSKQDFIRVLRTVTSNQFPTTNLVRLCLLHAYKLHSIFSTFHMPS